MSISEYLSIYSKHEPFLMIFLMGMSTQKKLIFP